jgi:hypothetical protein
MHRAAAADFMMSRAALGNVHMSAMRALRRGGVCRAGGEGTEDVRLVQARFFSASSRFVIS